MLFSYSVSVFEKMYTTSVGAARLLLGLVARGTPIGLGSGLELCWRPN